MFENISNNNFKTLGIFILGIIFILIATIFKFIENNAINKYYSGYENLFVSNDLEEDEKLSYLYPTTMQDLNLCNNENACYYIIYSDIYSFIVLMDKKNYQTLQTKLNKNNTRIIGITKTIKFALKQSLVAAYNKQYKGLEESYINIEDIESIYGKNYLDTTIYNKNVIVKDNDITKKPLIGFITFVILSVLCFISTLIKSNN